MFVQHAFTVTVELPPLDKVTGLTATSGAVHGAIALDWDPVDGADYYEVGQWRIQPGGDDYSWKCWTTPQRSQSTMRGPLPWSAG